MTIIKNIHRIKGILPDSDIAKLEAGASLHKRHSNITFKIIHVTDKNISVRAEQGKHLSGNYADTKTLITRTRELFGKFLPGRTVFTHPAAYKPSVVSDVTPEWITDRMLSKDVKIKDIISDTGVDKTNLSAWINGVRPMSQPVKAMFYFYFNR